MIFPSWIKPVLVAVWALTTAPFWLLGLFLLELPLWPEFSKDSTAEGGAVWVVLVVWVYIAPVIFLVYEWRKNHAQNH